MQLEVELNRELTEVRDRVFDAQEQGSLPQGAIPRDQLASVLSPRELKINDLGNRISTYLELDMESFLIFALMLMDRVVALTRHFYKQHDTHPSFSSFTQHRKFFLKSDNNPWSPDEEYARYIRDNTYWYESLLQIARDKLVVHAQAERLGGSHVRGLFFSGRDGDPRLVRLRWGMLQQMQFEKISALKAKYRDRIPQLENERHNVFEILDILAVPDHYHIQENEDRKEVRKLLSEVGGTLPDLNLLKGHIHDFLSFFNGHFTKLLSHYAGP